MQDFKGRFFPLSIGGEVKADAPKRAIKSPFDGQEVGEVAFAGEIEIEEAVKSTVAGFSIVSKMPSHERSGILRKISEGFSKNFEELAEIIRDEAGKPIKLARIEVERAVSVFAIAAEEAVRIEGNLLPLDFSPRGVGRTGLIKRFPVGPILGITPFNFPLMLAAHKVAPAIAAGNSIFIKPASQTPMSACRFAQIALEAGLPPGVFNVIPCSGSLANSLASDPRLKMLTFTGSAEVGWRLKGQAAKKKVTLELGGNAGAIVESDANVDEAAKNLAVGAFAYAGQICISVQRIVVHESVFATFLDKFIEHTRKNILYGDPREDGILCGPMIDSGNADRIEQWIAEARENGAKIHIGGTRTVNLVSPTVLTEVDPNLRISRQEAFGPIVVIDSFRTFDEAIAKINDSNYGLQAGVFTNDVGKLLKAFRELEVGGIMHNDGPSFRVDQMPYGGVKDSGFGREGLKYAIEEMTEPKLLLLKE